MKTLLFYFCLMLIILLGVKNSIAQISNIETPLSINEDGANPNPSAILDIQSSDKGILIPRLDTGSVSIPVNGLLIYQPSDNSFYYYNDNAWTTLSSGVSSEMTSIADADGDTQIQTEESTDEDVIHMDVAGAEVLTIERNSGAFTRIQLPNPRASVVIGDDAGTALTSGSASVFVGDNAGEDLPNTVDNTIIGANAAMEMAAGNRMTIIGNRAVQFSDNANNSTIIGQLAGSHADQLQNSVVIGKQAAQFSNATSGNVIIGERAGEDFDGAASNVVIGRFANNNGEGGNDNIVLGNGSGRNNNGDHNVIMGDDAGENNSGNNNIYVGQDAGLANESGNNNIALGEHAGGQNESGSNNIYIGEQAGLADTASNNVAIGFQAGLGLTVGEGNIFLGHRAGSTGGKGNGDIAIGQETASASRLFGGNVIIGKNAAFDLDSLQNNVIIGDGAADGFAGVSGNSMAHDNVIIGKDAGANAESSIDSTTVIGSGAGINIHKGQRNQLVGFQAGGNVRDGNGNVALGDRALYSNQDGHNNVAIGNFALGSPFGPPNPNFSQSNNVAIGQEAAVRISGDGNIAIGQNAGNHIEHSSENIYIGNYAGSPSGMGNQIGGRNNIFIGNNTQFEGVTLGDTIENSVALGTTKPISSSNTILLGDHVEIDDVGRVAVEDPLLSAHAVTLGYMENYVENNLPIHPHNISLGSDSSMTFAQCASYCRALNENGHFDWGIPSAEQLFYYTGITVDSNYLWTSTPFSAQSNVAWAWGGINQIAMDICSNCFHAPDTISTVQIGNEYKLTTSSKTVVRLDNGDSRPSSISSTAQFPATPVPPGGALSRCRCVR